MSDPLAVWASLRLEDGRLLGEAAESWQRADAAAILSTDGPLSHYLTRPRGGSKTSDLAAVIVALLVEQLAPGARAFAFAVDLDQAALLVDAVGGFVARTEGLAGALRVESSRVTAVRGGARLDVMAADAASAWGLKGDLFLVDEFSQWPTTSGPRRLWQAIVSAVPKVAGCRLVISTTAGDPAHFSHVVLEHAQGSERWRVDEVPGPVPWIDPEALTEQRRLLPESQYRRLHLNEWVTPEDSLVDAEDLAACVTLDGAQEPRSGASYRIGVDLGLKKDATAVAICHAEDSRVVLDRMLVWRGTRRRPVRLDEVEAAIYEASRRYHGARVVADPWQAVQLAQHLRARGVRVEEFTFSAQSVGRIASTLFRLLRDHAIALPDDAELLDELAHVRMRETSPGVLRLDHDPDKHDDRAVALALAAHALVEHGPGRPGVAVSAAGRVVDERRNVVPVAATSTDEVVFGSGRRQLVNDAEWVGGRRGRN